MLRFFNVFLRFFQNPKKRDFLRFFALLHTFSRTMAYRTAAACRGLIGLYYYETYVVGLHQNKPGYPGLKAAKPV